MSEELEDIDDAEEQKFNLYPKDGQEMQQLLIKLVKQRLEWFNFEDNE
jgi:hypothetical protein